MNIKMRFVDPKKPVIWVKSSELSPHPLNWRSHPVQQTDAMKGLLAEIGFADVVKGYRRADGSIRLIDGHLRTEIVTDQPLPVLLLDLTDEEADKLIATFDLVSSMAGVDEDNLAALHQQISFDNEAVNEMLESLQDKVFAVDTDNSGDSKQDGDGDSQDVEECWNVLVKCADEAEQVKLIKILQKNGIKDFQPLVS